MLARLAILAALALSISPAARADATGDLWEDKCAMCHGDTGHADTNLGKKHRVPDLTSPKAKALPNAKMVEIINNGVKDTKMKPWKGKITDAQIAALVQFIRGLQK